MPAAPSASLLELPQRWAGQLADWLWAPARERHGGVATLAIRALRLLVAVLRDLATGHLALRATGLVYVTILSLVPAIAVSLSILKALGVHRDLAPLLATWLQPLGSEGGRVAAGVVAFVERAEGNLLGGVGAVLLLLTTLSMARRVEASLNFVWRVDRPRNLVRRLSDYLAVLLVVPVAIVAVVALGAALVDAEAMRSLAGTVSDLPAAAPLAGLWRQATPYLLVSAAFAFVYWFVPNTRVQPLAALAGGVIGGVLWAATGAVFARFVVISAQTVSIYATFAIAIFTLLWLQLCWLILLVGAEVAFYLQYPDYLRLGYRSHAPGAGDTEALALATMLRVARAARSPRGPTPTDVAEELRLPAIVLAPVLGRLEAAGLLMRTDDDELRPAREPAAIPARAVVSAVRDPGLGDPVLAVAWPAPVVAWQARIGAAIDRELGDATLADLAEEKR
jgi:membrane protein